MSKYNEGDEVVLTFVGTIDSRGHIALQSGELIHRTWLDAAVDHYKIEKPEPTWRDVPEGGLFRFNWGGGRPSESVYAKTIRGRVIGVRSGVDVTEEVVEFYNNLSVILLRAVDS